MVTIFVPPNGNLVPNVVNENYQVAIGQLNNSGFTNIQRVPVTNPQLADGTVVLQNPKAGERVPANTQITLSVVQNPASPSPTPTRRPRRRLRRRLRRRRPRRSPRSAAAPIGRR